jgi:osmotically-inducible protein OsmY
VVAFEGDQDKQSGAFGYVNSVSLKEEALMRYGTVDSGEAKAAAAQIATDIEGAKSAKNELQVVSPAARKVVDANDKDIAKAVESRRSSGVAPTILRRLTWQRPAHR